jgi:hypothetical protein
MPLWDNVRLRSDPALDIFGVWIWIQSKCYGSATLVSSVIDTADHKKIYYIVEYLRKYEARCKVLTLWDKGPDGVVKKKTGGRKSCDRVFLRDETSFCQLCFKLLR